MVKGMRTRGLMLTLAATMLVSTLGVAPGAQAAAPRPAPSLSTLPYPSNDLPRPLVPGPDGALWLLTADRDPQTERVIPTLSRFGPRGLLTRTPVTAAPGLKQDSVAPGLATRTGPTPLGDGGMGVVVAQQSGSAPGVVHGVALVRVAAGGGDPQATQLPSQAQPAAGFGIAGDGTVWFARACADALYRRTPSGAVTRIPLRRLGCGGQAVEEQGSTVTVAPDASVWFVNLCQGRVAHVSRTLSVREWRTPSITCDLADRDGFSPASITLEPQGGIAFFSGLGQGAGRITPSGTIEPIRAAGPIDATPDGTLWLASTSGLGALASSGTVRPVPLAPGPAQGVTSVAADRTGTAWLLGGHFTPSYPYGVGSLAPISLGTLRSGGETAHWQLPDLGGTATATIPPGTPLTLGPDGALWTIIQSDGVYYTSQELLRILPADVATPRPPLATAVPKPLARVGRTVWLQLSCDADAGRYCQGSVTLAKASLVHAPAPFVIAGQSRGAVALQLSAAAARALHRGSLKATVRVASSGVPLTRATITIPGVKRSR